MIEPVEYKPFVVDRYYGMPDRLIPPEHKLRWISFRPIRLVIDNGPPYINPITKDMLKLAWNKHKLQSGKMAFWEKVKFWVGEKWHS